jgi:hypothetical protein
MRAYSAAEAPDSSFQKFKILLTMMLPNCLLIDVITCIHVLDAVGLFVGGNLRRRYSK